MDSTYQFMLFRAKQDLQDVTDRITEQSKTYDIADKKFHELSEAIVAKAAFFVGYAKGALQQYEAENIDSDGLGSGIPFKRYISDVDPLLNSWTELNVKRHEIAAETKTMIHHANVGMKRVDTLKYLSNGIYSFSSENYVQLMELTDTTVRMSKPERKTSVDRLMQFLKDETEELPPHVREYIDTWLTENNKLSRDT